MPKQAQNNNLHNPDRTTSKEDNNMVGWPCGCHSNLADHEKWIEE